MELLKDVPVNIFVLGGLIILLPIFLLYPIVLYVVVGLIIGTVATVETGRLIG